MVLSVPGEVLCGRKVLVLLVTLDLWLSLCFVCACVLDFVVVLLLLACWPWVGLGPQAELTPGEYRRLPAGSCSSALVPFLCYLVPPSLGFACGPRAWVGTVAESVNLGAILGSHAASTSTTSGPGW